jgi:membrane protein DedA with SNARE-associated domain
MSFDLIESLVAGITLVMATFGLVGLFGLMAVAAFGIPPIPSEVILPFAGFLVAAGTYEFGAALAVSVAGGLVGAFAAYAVGRWWRSHLIGLGVGRLRVRTEHMDRVDGWFRQHGEATVTLTQFVPFFRGYVSYPAGAARMHPAKFALFTLFGMIPWNLALIYAGFLLGSRWSVTVAYLEPFDDLFAALLVVGVAYLILVVAGVLTFGWPPRRDRGDGLRTSATNRAGGPPVPPAQ